jgi:hypothetical protein
MNKFPLRAFLLSTVSFILFLGAMVYPFFAGGIFQPLYIGTIIASGVVLGLFYSWVVYNRTNR